MGYGGVMDSGALVNRAIKDIKSRVLQALAFPKARALASRAVFSRWLLRCIFTVFRAQSYLYYGMVRLRLPECCRSAHGE